MSDDFIPLNQSTPTGGKWQGQGRNQNRGGFQNRYQNHNNGPRTPRRGHTQNRWGNNSQRNSSYGSDSNSSFGQDKPSIEAYLHPDMLRDPWAALRRKLADSK